MPRSLDEIADDIRDATKTYEHWCNEEGRLLVELKRVRTARDAASDFLDQYRDELLETVNNG